MVNIACTIPHSAIADAFHMKALTYSMQSLSMGGLGLHCLLHFSVPAYISSGTTCISPSRVQCLCHLHAPLGHHAVTCKHWRDVVPPAHHSKLRDVITDVCHWALITTQVEIGSGLGHTESNNTRPADILVPCWMLACLKPSQLFMENSVWL